MLCAPLLALLSLLLYAQFVGVRDPDPLLPNWLNLLPHHFRWKNQHTVRHPELLIRKGKILGRTKYVAK